YRGGRVAPVAPKPRLMTRKRENPSTTVVSARDARGGGRPDAADRGGPPHRRRSASAPLLVERVLAYRALGQMLAGAEQHRVERTGGRRADQRRHPEQPQLAGRTVTVEERHTGRARRVDRGVGDRDGDQVDQREREPDRQPGKPLGGAVLGGAEDD